MKHTENKIFEVWTTTTIILYLWDFKTKPEPKENSDIFLSLAMLEKAEISNCQFV